MKYNELVLEEVIAGRAPQGARGLKSYKIGVITMKTFVAPRKGRVD